MSVWLTIPSARPAAEANKVLAKWRKRGYKIALWLDSCAPEVDTKGKIRDEQIVGLYPGYAEAVNALVRKVMARDGSAEWFVIGGDDTEPDPNKTADEIAEECRGHFGRQGNPKAFGIIPGAADSTAGVMQPTGDRFAGGSIDRIAGSAWLGREWCLRANQGKGPLWPAFQHMFVDEQLKRVAEKLGVYWMRPDLTQLHHHFQRESDAIDSRAATKPVPDHLVKWNSREHWNAMQAEFKRLEAEDFASCMPLDKAPV